MTLSTWIIAILSFSLPAEYVLVGNSSEQIARHGPPGQFATQEFRSWEAPDGKFVTLFYWVPSAPRDGGPMMAVSETPAVVAGQETKIIETSTKGISERALVTHLHFSNPESRAMISARGLSLDEFRALLANLRVVPAESPPR